MSKPLPTNLELLLFLANESGRSYDDVYSIWCWVHTRPDSYLIVETILHLPIRIGYRSERLYPFGAEDRLIFILIKRLLFDVRGKCIKFSW